MGREEKCAARHPRRPVGSREDVEKAFRPLEIDDEDGRGGHGEEHRHERAGEPHERRPVAHEPEGRRQHQDARRDALRQEIQHEIESPGLGVRHVVVDAGIARPPRIGIGGTGRAQVHLPLTKHERARRNLRPDRALVRTEVENFRPGPFLRLPHHERLALYDLRDLARRIVEIAEDPALGRADADARRLELVLDAVRTEVALLGRARVGIDEQLIVRTRDHARAAADARVAVQIDDAVATLEERARSDRSSCTALRRTDCTAPAGTAAAYPGTCPFRPSSPSSG